MSEILPWMGRVEEMAREVALRENCLIYDIEFVGAGKGRTLRVFIDNEAGAIGIDECSNISKGLNLFLDEEDLIPGGPYNLEVSSPGLERSLKKPWHFQKVIGKKVWLKTSKPLETMGVTDRRWKAAKTVEAELKGVQLDQGIEFDIDGVVIKIPFESIEKAKLVFELSKGTPKKN